MIERTISFVRGGLEDDDAVLARNVNRLAGFRCAEWLKASLAQQIPDAIFDNEPLPEDWGWAMIVKFGDDLFLLACSPDENASNGWRVAIGDNFSRGILPWTRRRKKAGAAALADHVEKFLRSQTNVSGLAVA